MNKTIPYPTSDKNMIDYCLEMGYHITIYPDAIYCHVPKSDLCTLYQKYEEWKDSVGRK